MLRVSGSSASLTPCWRSWPKGEALTLRGDEDVQQIAVLQSVSPEVEERAVCADVNALLRARARLAQ